VRPVTARNALVDAAGTGTGTVTDVADDVPSGDQTGIPERATADPAVLAAVTAAAHAEAGPFVNPALLPAATRIANSTPLDWQSAVLGRPVAPGGIRAVSWAEAVVLLRAANVDADHLSGREAQQRAQAVARERERQAAWATQAEVAQLAWEQLRAALPVEVRVRHNWSIGHYDGHATGKDHVVVVAELRAGRLHRAAWMTLCQTPRRDQDLRALDRDPASTYAEERVPNCQGCLKVARRLAARP
jgi:hypothetical protein